MRFFSAAVLALTASSAAMADDKFAITPSGQPDAIYEGTTVSDASAKVVSECMNRGWQVSSQTSNQVVCQIPVSAMKSALQQMLIGNSYSTTPSTYVRFTIAQLGANARTQAVAWTETQMAFGQTRSMQYTDNGTFNNLLAFLMATGGKLPPGTRFPGVYIGFQGEPLLDGKKTVMPVQTLDANSPGAKAGLVVGDKIYKINGQTFKNMEELRKRLSKISPGVRYPITIIRDNREMTLTLAGEERSLESVNEPKTPTKDKTP